MEVDPTESLQEAGEEHIPEAVPLMASSQVKSHNIREDALLSLPMNTWVDRVCNETQLSREEALYHLEGFKWNWGAAMEACRSKTRPEQPSQLDNKLISSFFNEGFSQEDVSQFQASLGSQNQGYFKEGEIGSPMEVDPTESLQEAGEEHIPEAVPLMASSQVKIQNIREDTLSLPMDTWVDRVCNEIQVSREEALYYLEGFKWNLGAAMEACRSKTLPEQPSQLSEIAQASPNISTTSVSSQAGLDDPSSSSFSGYSSVDKTGAANIDKRLLNLAGNLTSDLVEEILLRVPVTSLARFSMACSRWGSLFRGSRFIYKHLMISQNHFLHSRQSEIWVVNTEPQPSCLKICDFGSETIRSMVQCNGLILCTTVSHRIVVLNGSQTRWIDKENLSLYDFYCLGHDSNKQYFVLRFNFGAFDRNCESYWTMAEVLDISSNTWSRVDIEDYWDVPRQLVTVSLDGNSYWIAASGSKCFVQSFNFSTQAFRPFQLPLEAKGRVALGSSRRDGLSLVCQQPQDFEVWIAKRIGDGAIIWGKLFVVTSDLPIFHGASFFIHQQKICMFCEESVEDEARIKILRIAQEGTQQMQTERYRYKTPSINCVYAPSLVPVPGTEFREEKK